MEWPHLKAIATAQSQFEWGGFSFPKVSPKSEEITAYIDRECAFMQVNRAYIINYCMVELKAVIAAHQI
jgi:hypothetical protein